MCGQAKNLLDELGGFRRVTPTLALKGGLIVHENRMLDPRFDAVDCQVVSQFIATVRADRVRVKNVVVTVEARRDVHVPAEFPIVAGRNRAATVNDGGITIEPL